MSLSVRPEQLPVQLTSGIFLLTLPLVGYHFSSLSRPSLAFPGLHSRCYPSCSSHVVTPQRERCPGRIPTGSRGDEAWKHRQSKGTELPQVLSAGQPEEPKSGDRAKTWNPEITPGLHCCFSVMKTFLLEFLLLLLLDSMPYTVIKS